MNTILCTSTMVKNGKKMYKFQFFKHVYMFNFVAIDLYLSYLKSSSWHRKLFFSYSYKLLS